LSTTAALFSTQTGPAPLPFHRKQRLYSLIFNPSGE
jgi:hypothetical protein